MLYFDRIDVLNELMLIKQANQKSEILVLVFLRYSYF